LAAGAVQADVFNMGPGLTSVEMVSVGNPGNAPDTRYDPTGYGRVAYPYLIGKYEVTAAQYCEFLNKVAATDTYGLYNESMPLSDSCKIQRSGSRGSYTYSVASGYANRPVNWVSFWDACRFVNWLHNGQKSAAEDPNVTEIGAYTLNGYNDTDGRTISRNANAKYWIPSENEWYKAAYYDGESAVYYDYPTASNTAPTAEAPPGRNNTNGSANYGGQGAVGNLTDVGAYTFKPSDSPYGTFDQGGNVWEWNDTRIGGSTRGLRGGYWNNNFDYLRASHRYGDDPTHGYSGVGLRVASVPEPGSITLLGMGAIGLLGYGWRRRKGRALPSSRLAVSARRKTPSLAGGVCASRIVIAGAGLALLCYTPGRASADLTQFLSRAAFNAAFPGAPLEDFEEARVADGNTALMSNPLDSGTNNAIFSPGEIIDGLRITVGTSSHGTKNLFLSSRGFATYVSHAISFQYPDTSTPQMTLDFYRQNARAFAFDLTSNPNGNTVTIAVFSGASNLGQFSVPNVQGSGTFFGVTSDADIITRVTLTDSNYFGVDNVALAAAVPEPSTLVLLGMGAINLLAFAWRRLKRTD
jgi:formylglycine-generating enzyme required for sulfatase activity